MACGSVCAQLSSHSYDGSLRDGSLEFQGKPLSMSTWLPVRSSHCSVSLTSEIEGLTENLRSPLSESGQ